MAIKCLSFDFDGTLTSEDFDKIIWNIEMPKLYAAKNKLTIKEAEDKVFSEYYRALYVEKVHNWTDIAMWFKRLGLTDYKSLMENLKHRILIFPDVIPVLEKLKKKYKLIIITASEEKFFNLKLDSIGIREYFDYFCVAPNQFGVHRKDINAYKHVINQLKLKPSEILHIGDRNDEDYAMARSVGMHALLLDRTEKRVGVDVIHSLKELPNKLKEYK